MLLSGISWHLYPPYVPQNSPAQKEQQGALDPGSEWQLHRDWFESTAQADLLDGDFSLAAKDTLYHCHDRLLPHKEAIWPPA